MIMDKSDLIGLCITDKPASSLLKITESNQSLSVP